jgi:hypothetical protein
MSAWMVNKEHIDALVHCALWGPRDPERPDGARGGWRYGGGLRWWTVDPVVLQQLPYEARPAARREANLSTADAVGAMLVAENLASIHHRYPDTCEGGVVPGPHDAYWTRAYLFAQARPVPTAVEALKLIDCYAYQSCEHPGWPASEAYSFCDALRHALVGVLDGYSAAPWGWPPEPER